MSNFWQRLLTGIVFVAVLISAIIFGPLSSQILFLWIALFSLAEFYRLFSSTANVNSVAGLITGCACFIIIAGVTGNMFAVQTLYFLLPVFSILFFIELYRKQQQPFINIALTITGIMYVVVPFSLVNDIAFINQNYHSEILLGYFFLVWSNDIMAYIFGRWLGRHRLFERISPKKSWEGSIGGLLSTMGVAYVISIYFTELSTTDWIIITFIIAITGTLGDLVESMLKRSLNIKDSGTILPGHGGFLDRFDALLLSVPFVLLYLKFR